MITLSLPDRHASAHTYRIAGEMVLVNTPITALHHLAIHNDQPAVALQTGIIDPPPAAGSLVYDGYGWIGNAWRHVTCTADKHEYRIHVEDVGRFSVSTDGQHVACLQDFTQPGSDVLIETLLGAPFILALAAHDIWCLHASALIADGRLLIFLGESGQGKSTLARELAAQPANGWTRAADDILPLSRSADGVLSGLPHFPQLKLPSPEQLDAAQPESLPAKAIYVLKKVPPDGDLISERLSDREASLALVRHTVAGRLFNRPVMASHLTFCTTAVQQIPIRSLSYPHRPEAISQVAAQITLDLRDLSG